MLEFTVIISTSVLLEGQLGRQRKYRTIPRMHQNSDQYLMMIGDFAPFVFLYATLIATHPLGREESSSVDREKIMIVHIGEVFQIFPVPKLGKHPLENFAQGLRINFNQCRP